MHWAAHSRCCRVASAQVRSGAWTDQISFTTLKSKQTVIAGTGGGYAGDAAPGTSYVLAGGPRGMAARRMCPWCPCRAPLGRRLLLSGNDAADWKRRIRN
jgi:hypothetical protein